MTYFECLRMTGEEDGSESYIGYLTEVCGHDEEYAKSMTNLQFRSC